MSGKHLLQDPDGANLSTDETFRRVEGSVTKLFRQRCGASAKHIICDIFTQRRQGSSTHM